MGKPAGHTHERFSPIGTENTAKIILTVLPLKCHEAQAQSRREAPSAQCSCSLAIMHMRLHMCRPVKASCVVGSSAFCRGACTGGEASLGSVPGAARVPLLPSRSWTIRCTMLGAERALNAAQHLMHKQVHDTEHSVPWSD